MCHTLARREWIRWLTFILEISISLPKASAMLGAAKQAE